MPRGIPNNPKPKTEDVGGVTVAMPHGVEDVELPADDGHGTLVGHLTHQFRDEPDCAACAKAYNQWEGSDKDLDEYHAAINEARRTVAEPRV